MQFLKSKKVITPLLVFFLLAIAGTAGLWQYKKGNIDVVQADTNDNVHGFAWADNYGWISFNSSDLICASSSKPKLTIVGSCAGLVSGNDCGVGGKCIAQTKSCSGNNAAFCEVPGDCHPGLGNCIAHDYAVKIDVDTGSTTGYAWNPLVGYICMGSTCPVASTTPDLVPPFLNYNRNTKELTGWAGIMNYGDRGWIGFSTSTAWTEIDSATGSTTGWAWNGIVDDGNPLTFDGLGWISFSSRDCDTAGDGLIDNPNCGHIGSSTSQYGVVANVNRPPFVTNLVAPVFTASNYCNGISVHAFKLGFTFNDDIGDKMSRYKIEMSYGNNSYSPISTASGTCPNAECNPTTNVQNFAFVTAYPFYDTKVYWRVTVWDSQGATSTIEYYPFPGYYQIPAFEYPKVSFTTSNPNPSAGEAVLFTGISRYHDGSNYQHCNDSNCSWLWGTSVIADTITAPAASSTVINFAQKNVDIVTFTATSTTGNMSCSTSTTMNVANRLPDWKEK